MQSWKISILSQWVNTLPTKALLNGRTFTSAIWTTHIKQIEKRTMIGFVLVFLVAFASLTYNMNHKSKGQTPVSSASVWFQLKLMPHILSVMATVTPRIFHCWRPRKVQHHQSHTSSFLTVLILEIKNELSDEETKRARNRHTWKRIFQE